MTLAESIGYRAGRTKTAEQAQGAQNMMGALGGAGGAAGGALLGDAAGVVYDSVRTPNQDPEQAESDTARRKRIGQLLGALLGGGAGTYHGYTATGRANPQQPGSLRNELTNFSGTGKQLLNQAGGMVGNTIGQDNIMGAERWMARNVTPALDAVQEGVKTHVTDPARVIASQLFGG